MVIKSLIHSDFLHTLAIILAWFQNANKKIYLIFLTHALTFFDNIDVNLRIVMQSFVYATCNSDLKKIYRNIVKNEYCESHDKIVGSVMQDIRYTMFILLSPMSF